MKIVVCIKQVPVSNEIGINKKDGTVNRSRAKTKINPYDLYALETAFRIKERLGGVVTVLTMGPKQAEKVIRDAFMMGADEGYILSDKKFSGSDVLATSFTLAQGIDLIGGTNIILCGRQTTDGDTAQIGPAIAEHLDIPHAAWVKEIKDIDDDSVTVCQNFAQVTQISKLKTPCLLTVEKGIFVPRLPSYKLKKSAMEREIHTITFADLPDQDTTRYGLVGSPTHVERVFKPDLTKTQEYFEGTAKEKSEALLFFLRKEKFVQEVE